MVASYRRREKRTTRGQGGVPAISEFSYRRINFEDVTDRQERNLIELIVRCPASDRSSLIEIIPIQKINEAYERMLRSDVKYRFVIDMASLK
jgi:uncharacterized zinc-type alcohol dehydrogenase-like protein